MGSRFPQLTMLVDRRPCLPRLPRIQVAAPVPSCTSSANASPQCSVLCALVIMLAGDILCEGNLLALVLITASPCFPFPGGSCLFISSSPPLPIHHPPSFLPLHFYLSHTRADLTLLGKLLPSLRHPILLLHFSFLVLSHPIFIIHKSHVFVRSRYFYFLIPCCRNRRA
jgi:hypothetical protein